MLHLYEFMLPLYEFIIQNYEFICTMNSHTCLEGAVRYHVILGSHAIHVVHCSARVQHNGKRSNAE
jgi:hypothetical protein